MRIPDGRFRQFPPEMPPGDTSTTRATRTHPAARASRHLALLALLVAVIGLAVTACGPSQRPVGVILTERLRTPFDVAERRALFGRSLDRFDCPPVLAPMRDVLVEGFYTDKDGSVVNGQAMLRYREARKPITDYESQITTISDAFVRSSPPIPATARCALEWLDAWAGQGALLGRVSPQGAQERSWTLSSIAAAYLKVRDAEGLEPLKVRRVEAWIRQLANDTTSFYSARTGPEALNSQAYRAGQASILAGVAVNDKGLFTWGIERYRLGISQIKEDGTLPLELTRRSKARYYHNLALMPLVLIGEVAQQNGIDLYAEEGGAIRRLVGRVVESLDDPGFFERAAGARQDWLGELSGASLAWAEPYFARFGDRRLVPWLLRFRPLRNPWFGGDATLLYGVPRLPEAG
jgi:poly(beta-D-mannuronate) lyase